MKATYWQRGEALDYKNDTSDIIPAGAVVTVGEIVGIAGADILPYQTGELHVDGVFEFPKTTASEVIEMGTKVYISEEGITATAENNKFAGIAACTSTAANSKVLVKL